MTASSQSAAQTAAITEFEASYVELARASLPSNRSVETIILGRDPFAHSPRRALALAGWWCRPQSAQGVLVLPNPWDERTAIATFENYCWDRTSSLVQALTPLLNEIHEVQRPVEYWDLLIAPWLLVTLTEVVDRRLFCSTAHAIAPTARFMLAGGQLVPAASITEAINLQLEEPWNTALLEEIVQALDLPVGRSTVASAVGGAGGASALTQAPSIGRSALNRSFAAAVDITIAAVRGVLGRTQGRRLALVGDLKLRVFDLVRLSRRVPGARVAPRSARTSHSVADHEWQGARERLTAASGRDHLDDLVIGLLPRLLPRSALEDYRSLVADSERRYGPPTHVVHGNYGWGDAENEFMARSRAAGRELAFAQHGGSTLQLAIAPLERHEKRHGAMRISWGGAGPAVRPAANPYVQRLLDGHRGGRKIVIVEHVTPPLSYLFRFCTVPLANQVYLEEEQLVRFVRAAAAVQQHMVLKRFPYFSETQGRHPELERLPDSARGLNRSAAAWMRRARVAVCTYPDTPFLEAMVLGVPTIGLWGASLWEMREDAAGHFDELAGLGIIHADPVAAATKVEQVYAAADSWWAGAEIQDARRRFLQRFAKPGDWLDEWAPLIRELAS